MSAPVLPFTVINCGKRPRRAQRRSAAHGSPLMRKIATLERVRPNAAVVCEMLVDNWLRKVGVDPQSAS